MNKINPNPKQFQILDQQLCYDGFFKLYRYQLKHTLFAGGWSEPLFREVLERGQAVAVLPYDPHRDQVVMIEQFRPGAMYSSQGAWLWEIVAGIIEPDEHPEQVAQRETHEESGCEISALIKIYDCFASPGGATETTTLFCACVDASTAGGIHGVATEHEDIQVHVLDFAAAMAKLNSGQLHYAPAIMALQWLALNRPWLRQTWGNADNIGEIEARISDTTVLQAALTQLPSFAADELQWVTVAALESCYYPSFATDRPVLLATLYTAADLATVYKVLKNAYPPDFQVHGLPLAIEPTVWTCDLVQLTAQLLPTQGLLLFIPADKTADSFPALLNTIAHLRAPNGCPWDRKQTLQSLRRYLLEEVYEVLEALDANDTPALAEELGDLLLQIVLQTQVAADNGDFQMRDVLTHINQKMLRRHPHVFGAVEVADADAVITHWELIKRAEKAAKGDTTPQSILTDLPSGLPALVQALTVSKKVARAGFDWQDLTGVLDKVIEEAREVAAADNAADLEAEIGDLLFCVVQLARWHEVDPESALRSMCARFTRRFQHMEQLIAAADQTFADLSSTALDDYWQQAKILEKKA